MSDITKKIGYYLFNEECINDVRYIFSAHCRGDNGKYLAECCAEHYWRKSDDRDIEDIELMLVVDGEEVGVFNVEVEIEPTFWAREKK